MRIHEAEVMDLPMEIDKQQESSRSIPSFEGRDCERRQLRECNQQRYQQPEASVMASPLTS